MLLCRDCKNSDAKRLRKTFKAKLKAAGLRTIRPLVTSCQDVCPGRGTAVSLLVAGRTIRTYVVRTDAEADALVDGLCADGV